MDLLQPLPRLDKEPGSLTLSLSGKNRRIYFESLHSLQSSLSPSLNSLPIKMKMAWPHLDCLLRTHQGVLPVQNRFAGQFTCDENGTVD